MDELKPCPFCGKAPTPDFSVIDGEAAYHFHCQNAECPAWPNVSGETEEDAITAWNTRPPVTDEMVELAARAMCKSGKYETGEGTCSLLCMEFLGSPRKSGCGHSTRIHGEVARAALTAALGGPHG